MIAQPVTTLRSQSSWNVDIAGRRFAITRIRERQVLAPSSSAGPGRARGSTWSLATGGLISVGALSLVMAGAWAASYKAAPAHYAVQLAVPAAIGDHPASRHHHRRAGFVAGRVSPAGRTAPAGQSDAGEVEHIADALRTGELQEWIGADGRHRFLTVGDRYAVDGGHCRNLALLTREANGGDHVHATRRCTTGATDGVFGENDLPQAGRTGTRVSADTPSPSADRAS